MYVILRPSYAHSASNIGVKFARLVIANQSILWNSLNFPWFFGQFSNSLTFFSFSVFKGSMATLMIARAIILCYFEISMLTSQRWEYCLDENVWSIVENFIDAAPVKFVENQNCAPTILFFSGATTHPDLFLVHPNLLDHAIHLFLPAPGGTGHKLLVANLKYDPSEYKEPCFPSLELEEGELD